MVTMAQRIEALREERGVSRAALSSQLSFPKNAVEKFEIGRQTPTKEQQETLASYFGVSLFYLRGESGDRTRQEDWMADATLAVEGQPPRPAPPAPKAAAQEPQGALFDALLASKQVQGLLKGIVLDTLKSPEGRAIIESAVKKALAG